MVQSRRRRPTSAASIAHRSARQRRRQIARLRFWRELARERRGRSSPVRGRFPAQTPGFRSATAAPTPARCVTGILHIVAHHGAQRSSILALTFTRSAAMEMERRVGLALGPRAAAVRVSTFHALALRLCKRFHAALGLPAAFPLYSTRQLRRLCVDALQAWAERDGALPTGAPSRRTLRDEGSRLSRALLVARAKALDRRAWRCVPALPPPPSPSRRALTRPHTLSSPANAPGSWPTTSRVRCGSAARWTSRACFAPPPACLRSTRPPSARCTPKCVSSSSTSFRTQTGTVRATSRAPTAEPRFHP